jgi:type VI secretion system protein ImpG
MDERLYQYYERELLHLRSTARQFAEAFPKVAARLALTDDPPCPDPYVERLLEGVAFLSARTQLKLDSEFPRFTQNLIGTVYPQYLAPMPSVTIVQFVHDPKEAGLAGGYGVPRGTVLRSEPDRTERGETGTQLEFRTCHDLMLWPLVVSQAQYYIRELPLLNLSTGERPRAALRLRLKTTANVPLSKLAAGELVLFLRGPDTITRRLYEQIIGRTTKVLVRPVPPPERNRNLPPEWETALPAGSVGRVGFGADEALLPYDERGCQAYRLINEYFALPQRFLFFRLSNLRPVWGRFGPAAQEVDVVFLLSQEDLELEGNIVAPEQFLLGCTPAINLFPRRAAPIFVEDRATEHRVVIDPKAPLDHEIWSVTRVVGYGERPEDEREFRPFYAASDFDDVLSGAYFATNRTPRTLTEAERRGRGRSRLYQGSDVYLSLVDANAAPYPETIKQLSVEVLCSNRDLPIHLNVDEKRASHLSMLGGGPIAGVRCVVRPTVPRAAWGEGEAAWRGISHLSLNYLSLTDSDESSGAAGLRELLRLYADPNDPSQSNQVKGVRSILCAPVHRQLPTPGPVTYARGLEVRVTLDPSLFEDAGVFLLGAVLEEFFARYVSINSFTETVILTTQGKEVMRWPTRLGHRPVI